MKIKMAILENDANYLSRLTKVFGTKYAENLEIYAFTDQSIAMNSLDKERIDVFLSSVFFTINVENIPKRCGFAYLVDSPDIDSYLNQRAICKFQKAELIYKQILSIYAENAGRVSGLKVSDKICRLITFASVSGGSGSSVICAAAARHLAMQGKKPFYLNLENYGMAESLFTGDGQFTMSDIIFALKSKNSNLTLKLESFAKRDPSGVSFFASSEQPLDMMELTIEEKIRLLTELQMTGNYDYILVDMNIAFTTKEAELLDIFDSIILVGTGTEISNRKLQRVITTLSIMDQQQDTDILKKLQLLYNQFDGKTCFAVDGLDVKNLGGIPRFEPAADRQISDRISRMTVLDALI